MTDRYFKKHCIDCYNFNIETGCSYGVTRFDTDCMFMPKIEIATEADYYHRFIRCPAMSIGFDKCNGNMTPVNQSNHFEPCTDCPIDWSKLRVNTTNLIYDYGYGGYVIE